MLENTELKKKVASLQSEKLELKQYIGNVEGHGGVMPHGPVGMAHDMNEMYKVQQQNEQLQGRVEFLQKRERELLDTVTKQSQGSRMQHAQNLAPYRWP